jgi:hypothetical protein
VHKQLGFSDEIKTLAAASAKALRDAGVVLHAGQPNGDSQDIRALSVWLSIYALTPESPPDSACPSFVEASPTFSHRLLLGVGFEVNDAPPVCSGNHCERADELAIAIGVGDRRAMNQHEPCVLKRPLRDRGLEECAQHLMTFNVEIQRAAKPSAAMMG